MKNFSVLLLILGIALCAKAQHLELNAGVELIHAYGDRYELSLTLADAAQPISAESLELLVTLPGGFVWVPNAPDSLVLTPDPDFCGGNSNCFFQDPSSSPWFDGSTLHISLFAAGAGPASGFGRIATTNVIVIEDISMRPRQRPVPGIPSGYIECFDTQGRMVFRGEREVFESLKHTFPAGLYIIRSAEGTVKRIIR